MKVLRKTAPRITAENIGQLRPEGLPQITINEWLSAYLATVADKEDKVPDGYFSVEEIAKSMKACRSTASERVNALHRAGRADRVKLRRMIVGRIRIVPYYKLSVVAPGKTQG